MPALTSGTAVGYQHWGDRWCGIHLPQQQYLGSMRPMFVCASWGASWAEERSVTLVVRYERGVTANVYGAHWKIVKIGSGISRGSIDACAPPTRVSVGGVGVALRGE